MEVDNIVYWLKNSIWGIVILGAFGSLLGVVFFSAIKYIFSKIVGFLGHFSNKSFIRISLSYIRKYLVLRATILQLRNKGNNYSLTSLHNRYLLDKQTAVIISWVLFFIITVLFSIFGAEYAMLGAFLVSIFFLFLHEAIVSVVLCWVFDEYLYSSEEKLAMATYKDEIVAMVDLIISLQTHYDRLHDIEIEEIVEKIGHIRSKKD